MYLAHIQRHTTQGRRGTSAGRRARPLQHHRAPRRCTGVDGTSSCLTGSLSLAKPRGGDIVGDQRQRLLVCFDSTRPSDSVGCARWAACRDERVRHLPAREGMPQRMARTGLSGLMVHGRRSLQMATSHHHCHRVGAARPSHTTCVPLTAECCRSRAGRCDS